MTVRARTVSGFPMAIVGESHHLENFVAVFGERRPYGIDCETDAIIEYEDGNPHDPLAVVVKIDGRAVGHLGRLDARLYRDSMTRCGCSERSVLCSARVRCGWDNGCGSVGDFSVTLSIDIDRPVE